MLLFEFPVIRSHIWLVFDVTSAMAICRHDDPFGQQRALLTWLPLSVKSGFWAYQPLSRCF